MSQSELSEQEQLRMESLAELRKLGIDPYPADEYKINASSTEILEEYNPDKNSFQNVSVAGRLMNRRIMTWSFTSTIPL